MEVIRGNPQQRQEVNLYLTGLRSVLPMAEFSTKTTNTRFDSWLQSGGRQRINFDLFWQIAQSADVSLSSVDPNFRLLPFTRYVVGEVDPAVDPDTGGFHSRYSRGFKYLSNCGFAVVLNPKHSLDPDLAAVELGRSYIHDSIHASTFRSIRAVPEGIESRFPVYREQYGFNFRRADGTSYSPAFGPEESPERININLLMDGLTVMMTAQELAAFTSPALTGKPTDFERTILADITLDAPSLPDSYRGKTFHQQVTYPAQKFLNRMGGNSAFNHLTEAMLTGNMRDVVHYFNDQLGSKNSWKSLFKIPLQKQAQTA